ncbi:MAG: helix-hairpin-helix domain-containing protein [Armatimonadota bacterium]
MRVNPTGKTIGLGLAAIIGLIGIFRLTLIGSQPYAQSRDEGFTEVSSPKAIPNADATADSSAPSQPQPSQTGLREGTIRIYVCGQVKRPSVMTIPASYTAYDAIKRAGGLTDKADAERVNLAACLSDGQQLYIPAKGQAAIPTAQSGPASPKPPSATESNRGNLEGAQQMVNINSAELEDLDRLPGIGPVLAQRIIDYRNQNGRFGTADELMEVKGIGQKKLEQVRPFIEL